jgi:hypothetical protein
LDAAKLRSERQFNHGSRKPLIYPAGRADIPSGKSNLPDAQIYKLDAQLAIGNDSNFIYTG